MTLQSLTGAEHSALPLFFCNGASSHFSPASKRCQILCHLTLQIKSQSIMALERQWVTLSQCHDQTRITWQGHPIYTMARQDAFSKRSSLQLTSALQLTTVETDTPSNELQQEAFKERIPAQDAVIVWCKPCKVHEQRCLPSTGRQCLVACPQNCKAALCSAVCGHKSHLGRRPL